jgi:membrane protein implicated in regulation of membrane protease activity
VHDTEGDTLVGKIVGVMVGIAVALFALWLLVDMAWYLWGGMAALIFAFLLVFLVVYIVDRRKLKESQDLFAN